MDERIIVARLDALDKACVVRISEIDGCRVRFADYVAPSVYRYGSDWLSLESRRLWPAGKTVFLEFELPSAFHAGGSTPRECEAHYLRFDGEGWEGLLSVDGVPYSGIDINHVRVPFGKAFDNDSFVEGRRFSAEMISLPRVWHATELARESSVLHGIILEIEDTRARYAVRELQFAWQSVQFMEDEYRRTRIRDAMEEALRAVDLTLDGDVVRTALIDAHRRFRTILTGILSDPEGVGVFLTGHSHIDVAWLWPLRETIRKCARTFSTACRLMEHDDRYHFSCSQPQLYAYTKRHYPKLYDEICAWVDTGRWETTGGMWVESDCNSPSGESLIRQILVGVRFFEREFGKRPRTCWLPDVFGYPATLPQILTGCGIEAFYTNKLHWQSQNRFPASLFWWEGTDGSRILAHVPKLMNYYNGSPVPEQLYSAVEHFQQKLVFDEVMLPFGYGDGGGGPTEEMLDFARIAESFPGVPKCRQGGEEQYFKKVIDLSPDLPVWRGELYLETHRGTFTSQARTKRMNRRCETLLKQAEILSVLAAPGSSGRGDDNGSGVPEKSVQRRDVLGSAWENLLLLQFHDILPGSSIGEVYREASEDYSSIRETAVASQGESLSVIAGQVGGDGLVFTSLSSARTAIVRFAVPNRRVPLLAEWPDGTQTALQWVEDDPVAGSDFQTETDEVIDARIANASIKFGDVSASYYLGFTGALTPVGVTPVRFVESGAASDAHSISGGSADFEASASTLSVSDAHLENSFFRVELNAVGEITRLYDKTEDREVVAADNPGNQFHLYQDGPEREAAWNVHDTFDLERYEFDGDSKITVIESGPVRASILLERKHRNTVIKQRISVYESIDRIDFATYVEWRERQCMLKAVFPVLIRSDKATYDIQFGTVERPTHRNTTWDRVKFEVPHHQWVDLSEHGYGVSLLNDSFYGCDVKENVIRLTLLRGPEWPDPAADVGVHRFTYSVLPHVGGVGEARVEQRALDLNEPAVYFPARSTGSGVFASRGFCTVDGPAIVSAVKPAEDGNGIIVRVYEPYGSRGRVTLNFERSVESFCECNHLEESLGSNERKVEVGERSISYYATPQQVRSFKILFT